MLAQRTSILVDAIERLKRHPAIDALAIGVYGSSQARQVVSAAPTKTVDVAFLVACAWLMQNSIEQSAYLVHKLQPLLVGS